MVLIRKLLFLTFLSCGLWSCQGIDSKSVDCNEKIGYVYNWKEIYNCRVKPCKDIFDNIVGVVFRGMPIENNAIRTSVKILKIDDGYVCFENYYNHVYVFGKNGNWRHTIKNSGRGPMEFYYINAIAYDGTDKRLYVLNGYRSVISMDINGKKMEETRLDIRAARLEYDEDRKMILAYREEVLDDPEKILK